jgi:hypothetical protein
MLKNIPYTEKSRESKMISRVIYKIWEDLEDLAGIRMEQIGLYTYASDPPDLEYFKDNKFESTIVYLLNSFKSQMVNPKSRHGIVAKFAIDPIGQLSTIGEIIDISDELLYLSRFRADNCTMILSRPTMHDLASINPKLYRKMLDRRIKNIKGS